MLIRFYDCMFVDESLYVDVDLPAIPLTGSSVEIHSSYFSENFLEVIRESFPDSFDTDGMVYMRVNDDPSFRLEKNKKLIIFVDVNFV